ncbi:Fis family transcriptional regulator [Actinomadura cremea]|nr:Fis family transcriptional regulator [Actinomadura cremea]
MHSTFGQVLGAGGPGTNVGFAYRDVRRARGLRRVAMVPIRPVFARQGLMTENDARPADRPGFPPELAGVLRPGLPALARDLVDEVRWRVPAFDEPLRGESGAAIRKCVERCLARFVDRIADPSLENAHNVKILTELGRRAFHEGRSMESLQAAYRIGVRLIRRRFTAVGLEAGFSAETVCALAEAMFAHLEEIVSYSAQGYSEQATRLNGTLRLRRRHLLELLTTPGQASEAVIRRTAAETQWRLPAAAACVALEAPGDDVRPISFAVDPDVLMDLESPYPFLLVPDADGPGRQKMLDRALGSTTFAVGPTLPVSRAALSLRLARQTLGLVQRGIVPADPPPRSVDHLSTLLLFSDEDIITLMIQRTYARTDDLRVHNRGQLPETLLTLLTTGGSAPEISARLNVHPQTVRNRMSKIEELFGDRIHDPRWRFDMQIILRSQALLDKE